MKRISTRRFEFTLPIAIWFETPALESFQSKQFSYLKHTLIYNKVKFYISMAFISISLFSSTLSTTILYIFLVDAHFLCPISCFSLFYVSCPRPMRHTHIANSIKHDLEAVLPSQKIINACLLAWYVHFNRNSSQYHELFFSKAPTPCKS